MEGAGSRRSMADPAPLGADGATPLTASEWGEAARGVALAKRVGAVAVSVRHITLHLSTLEFPSGMAHGHGHLAPGPARQSRRAGLRSACSSARGASRGSGRGPAGAAPGVAASPSPSVSADDTSAETNASASAGAATAPAAPRHNRGWLRSAAFHHWRRVALRRAFSMLCMYEAASHVQCDVMPQMQCVVAATPLLAARPCEPSGPPSAGSANLMPMSPDSECGRVKRPPSPLSAEARPSPFLRLHKKQMNVHAPAFLPSVPDNSEL